jgi:hypothetical protein
MPVIDWFKMQTHKQYLDIILNQGVLALNSVAYA